MTAVMKNLLHNRHNSESTKRKSLNFSWRENEDEARGRSLRSQSPSFFQDRPPTPPPKDEPSTPNSPFPSNDMPSTPTANGDAASVFSFGRLSRAGSVYSLSRISFKNQINQLTDIQLPDAEALKSSVSAIPTAEAAAGVLQDAADQIQRWIKKASDVLDGLDADDDAEWAAAAGREGLVQVDQAVSRFESLTNVYIISVEELQLREDAATVPKDILEQIADQVENISRSWRRIKKSMSMTKHQVELAIEWQSFRDSSLGVISAEIEELSRIVFEMEERRHQAPVEDQHIDIGKIETMIQDNPKRSSVEVNTRPQAPSDELTSPTLQSSGFYRQPEEQNLLGLFARLQPLRAQIEFLPMQMTAFEAKARDMFPAGCRDLEERRTALESQWSRLESDAASLQKELADDRWNVVFRNASRQALSMIKSVKKALDHVDEAVENNVRLRHSPATTKKIENYEAKKQHYCPAIERVLLILDRGVKNRLTVNGEISRLEEDIRSQWRTLQHEIKHMDSQLEEYTSDTGMSQQQLRDSVSTILSNESVHTPNALLTPGTSPPSSRARSRKSSQGEAPHTLSFNKPRQASGGAPSTPAATPRESKRFSSLPTPNRRTPVNRSVLEPDYSTMASSPLAIPPSLRPPFQRPTPASADNRPRWSYAKKTGDYNVSDYYRSLMSKGKHYSPSSLSPRHASAPYQPSISTPPSQSNPLGTDYHRPTSATTPSRPMLHRKRSDITPSSHRNSMSTPVFARPRATTSMGSRSAEQGRSMIPVPTNMTSPSNAGTRNRRASNLGSMRDDSAG